MLYNLHKGLPRNETQSIALRRAPPTSPISRSRNRTRAVNCQNLILSAVVSGVIVVSYGSAWAQMDWRKWAPANFPARVKAIVGLPPAMDAHNCVRYGQWDVCFGGQPPIATFKPIGLVSAVHIEPLRCKNPVSGERECKMRLIAGWSADNPEQCYVDIDWAVKIRCPSGLVLE